MISTKLIKARLSSLSWLLILLALITSSLIASASSSLDRHSPDFQYRLTSYGDVWTQNEVLALTEVLNSLKQYGVAHVSTAVRDSGEVLNKLISKLQLVDERISLALRSLLGLSKDLPEDLSSRISNVSISSKNTSRLIKVINHLYSNGELSGVDYLVLIGHVANELKEGYVEDSETITNLRRAIDEISSIITKSTIPPLPEPDISSRYNGAVLLIKPIEVPKPVLIAILLVVLVPPATHASLSFRTRTYYSKLLRKAQLTSDLIVSSLSFPEDTVSAYWVAVGILSKVITVNPWETHREFLARLGKELKNQQVLSVFKTLTEEYEKVRFAGEVGSLSRKQLVDIVVYIANEVRYID
ncbi:MAG: DUF4129 domain-containing protein [Sulfolobales archaeon]